MLGMEKTIVFAGGHFSQLQYCFDQVEGVTDTKAGYANGVTAFPKYEDVIADKTEHALSVKVFYDPEIISLKKLIEAYLSFLPKEKEEGNCYRLGIYYEDLLDGVEIDLTLTEEGAKPLHIEVMKLCNFFIAELKHQHQNPAYYKAS